MEIYDKIYEEGFWINIGPATYVRFLLMKKLINWGKKDVVLDAGCGSGRFLSLLSPFVKEIHGIDISEEALKIAKTIKATNVKIEKGSILKIPYKNGVFDKVICIDVIEHIKNDEKALKEIKRVLKSNGEGVIYFVAGKLNPKIGHVYTYSVKEIQKLTKKVGLKIEKIKTHRSIIDRIINPIRKPSKDVKKKRKISHHIKLLAYLMLLELYIPFLPVQGYMVKVSK